MDEGIRQKIERWKIKAEVFLKNNTKAFIVDVEDHYHWCHILKVNEDSVEIKNFTGARKLEEERIYWSDVVKFEEYREEGQ